jgi:hypothetical protein
VDGRLVSGNRAQHLNDLKDAIETYASLQPDYDELQELAAASAVAIDARIEEIGEDEEEDNVTASTPVSPASRVPDQIASIFDDVDD